jgi:hypothetical protein
MNRRGIGSAYKRGQVWWIQYCHRGQVFRESTGSKVRADASALLRQRLGEIGSGMVRPRDAENLTFEAMASMLEDDYRVNERRSLARARQSLSHLRDFFGTCVAADMGSQRIAAYIRHRMHEAKPPAKPAIGVNSRPAAHVSLAKRHGIIFPQLPAVEGKTPGRASFDR